MKQKRYFPPTSFYLNPTQKAQVVREAEKANLSLSEFIRRKVLGANYQNETAVQN